ncbi:MAG TPA: beta-N-acetylhexosaminidase [Burkholderiaceae bacterium]|nr:beta-N-acetylhexosaminidase [Burkholderiaceae bacterium]
MSASNSTVELQPGPVMVDVEGLSLTEHERQRLRHPLVGGVILFARNFRDRDQLHDLCRQIRLARKAPLLIAVDHEGGRVQRFRDDGFTHIPSMRRIGTVWESDPWLAQRLACDAGYVMALELRACGVDMTFAPVLDLDYGVSTVIGDRAFHHDPQVVTSLARALAHGLALAGMGACGKHFPGHGAVRADSHHEIPVDERQRDEIISTDAAPYAWLGDLALPSVMPAHVIYPNVDVHPAGFSRVWLQEILRGDLAYDGVVFSDDLTMEGATVAGDILARAQAALQAGCDMVLVCNRPDMADDLLGRLQFEPDAASVQRIRCLIPTSPCPDRNALQSDKRYQDARQRLRSETLSG